MERGREQEFQRACMGVESTTWKVMRSTLSMVNDAKRIVHSAFDGSLAGRAMEDFEGAVVWSRVVKYARSRVGVRTNVSSRAQKSGLKPEFVIVFEGGAVMAATHGACFLAGAVHQAHRACMTSERPCQAQLSGTVNNRRSSCVHSLPFSSTSLRGTTFQLRE